jgi:hypothetical protein
MKASKKESTLRPIRPCVLFLCVLILGLCFGGCSSDDGEEMESVTPLRVERVSCYQAFDFYPRVLGAAEADGVAPPETPGDSPFCSCVFGVLDKVPLVALLNEDGTEMPATEPVTWTVSDPAVASITPDGVLTFLVPGQAAVTACLGDVCTEPYPVSVVENPDVVQLEIFPGYYYPVAVFADIGFAVPDCLDCFFEASLRLLIGGTADFFARGVLATGSWVDLTSEVDWHSSDAGVASVDPDGLLSAHAEGACGVTATYEGLTSNTVQVEVLAEALLVDLWIYRQSMEGILKVGSIDQLHVDAYYDPWMLRDVTGEVEWIVSDPSLAAVSAEGILTALAPGLVTIRASYEGAASNEIELEIWDEVEMEYCDPENPNRGFWADEYNRVILETDCAEYPSPDEVFIRYTIEENQPHPWGILDPCLDLVVLDEAGEIVKTLRFEGCGDLPFAMEAGARADFDPIYQYSTTWNRTDDGGLPLGPGEYTIAGRFYIYYDPVVRVKVRLEE